MIEEAQYKSEVDSFINALASLCPKMHQNFDEIDGGYRSVRWDERLEWCSKTIEVHISEYSDVKKYRKIKCWVTLCIYFEIIPEVPFDSMGVGDLANDNGQKYVLAESLFGGFKTKSLRKFLFGIIHDTQNGLYWFDTRSTPLKCLNAVDGGLLNIGSPETSIIAGKARTFLLSLI